MRVDLHGYYKRDALAKIEQDIGRIKQGLQAKMLQPNVGNGRDHVYYVICGAGTHSKDHKAVLKFAVQEWLSERKLDYWDDMKNGIFFVRLDAHS